MNVVEYDVERMYPPIRNVSSQNHLIEDQAYGNGLYVIDSTSTRTNYQPFNFFNTSDTIGGAWADNNYNSNGTLKSSFTNNLVSGYNGEWVKIKFPVAINITKYGFRLRPGFQNRAPNNFKIYGSNDDTNWVQLIERIGTSYVNGEFETTISTSGTYNSFGLVVNKLGYDVILNFDECFIYGK